MTSQHHLILRDYPKGCRLIQVSSSLSEWSTKEVSLPTFLEEEEEEKSLSFAASCKELFCLSYNDEEGFILWNSSTGEYKLIPSSNLDLPFCKLVNDVGHTPTCTKSVFCSLFGLGFDSKSNDYKFLKLTNVWYFDDGCFIDMHSSEKQISVYSLSTDSWKEVSFCESSNIGLVDNDCVSLDGICYWGDLTDSKSVVSFSFASEEFSNFLLPDIQLKSDTNACLVEFCGSLAFVVSSWYGFAKCFRFWTLDVVDGVSVWVRKVKLDACGVGLWNPLGFCRNGGSLLLQGINGTLFEYDYYTQNMNKIEEISSKLYSMMLVSFVESTVNLTPKEEKKAKGKEKKRKEKWILTPHMGKKRKEEADDE